MAEPSPPAVNLKRFTLVYKSIGDHHMKVDVYIPIESTGVLSILAWFHGGGWSDSNRTDVNLTLFKEFLSRNYSVCSMDYRLVPEVALSVQMEDVKDGQLWLRSEFPKEMSKRGIQINYKNVVVGGASSGAHLAFCTPKYCHPSAILAFYGPTDLHHLEFQNQGRLSKDNLTLLPCTPDLLKSATYFPNFISEGRFSRSPKLDDPRFNMVMHAWRNNSLVDYIIKGLVRGKEGALELPEKGSALTDEVDEFNPLHIFKECEPLRVCIFTGTLDGVFLMSHHITEARKVICERGGSFLAVEVDGQAHSFDINPDTELLAEKHFKHIVDWVCKLNG